ncbi:MAG: ATP-dependent zinc metalloprotease FtsH [Myxococcota bacterium]|nr:ATP-dependent zinc metalloprotease FtsH [Myxococcota bacterium]
MKQPYKSGLLWLFLILMFIVAWQFVSQRGEDRQAIRWGLLASLIESELDALKEVTVQGDRIFGEFKQGVQLPEELKSARFTVTGPKELGDQMRLRLEQHDRENADFSFYYKAEEKPSFLQTFLISWLPMIVLLVFFLMFMRQVQGNSGRAMSFGKSRARLLNEQHKKVTFKDIAGVEEAKGELEEVVHFLKDPKKFTRLGGRIPKGVLLMGPPGTGKTLLARGVAGEAGVPFYSISGSDFVEMFVGVGASRVRDLFEQGKKSAPCIIFIDEIDAVGRHRGAGLGGGHDEREQTLNQLLVEMDGFESNDGVILIAATNRPDVLDPALLRPGRFDRRVVVSRPDVRGREQILRVHTRKIPLEADCEMGTIARGTPGFSGADLENLVNEAALLAARYDRDKVQMIDFEEAKDKVIMGTERRSMVLSEKERRTTAYHEAGHALVAQLLPGTDPVHKVTIIPRGRALGLTQQLPMEDRLSMTKSFAEKRIAILMGGRIAEEIKFNQITTGAGQDIDHATKTARSMVCQWGMSKKLGPLAFGQKNGDQPFLGRDGQQSRDFSEQTAQEIDGEVRRIVTEGYDVAWKLIEENLDKLEAMALALLERETIDTKDIELLMKGEPLPPLEESGEAETEAALDAANAQDKVEVSSAEAAADAAAEAAAEAESEEAPKAGAVEEKAEAPSLFGDDEQKES